MNGRISLDYEYSNTIIQELPHRQAIAPLDPIDPL